MNKKIAIVTGAGSGLGKEFVRLLAGNNEIEEIYVLGRNEERLNNLISEFGEKIKPYPVDLSDKENIKAFGKYLQAKNVDVKILINNAGYAKFCSYDDLSVDESLNMTELNINAVVAMGLVCLPFMNRGAHIINISSQSAFQPVPFLNIYAATKSFVKNYSRALNVELREKGITVTAVCPGWLNTNFYERANINAPKSIKNFLFKANPEKVAKKALNDTMKGKDISVYGAYVNICGFFSKIMPEKLIMKIWLLQQNMK